MDSPCICREVSTVAFEEPSRDLPMIDLIMIILTSSLFIGPILLFLFLYLLFYLSIRQSAHQTSDITYSPVVPNNLRGSNSSRTTGFLDSGGIRVETLDFPVQKCCKLWNQSQGAIDWIQSIITKHHGSQIRVPKDTCLLSVPMDNFQCSGGPCDFQPSRGPSSDSHLTFQMIGANIQVTRYVERGVAYVAGYCIYISHPYQYSWGYSTKLIEECYRGPKYHLEPSAPILLDTVDETEEPEGLQESEVRRILEQLKSTYCEHLQKPVLIGASDSGVTRHFEWDHVARCWRTEDCDKCAYQVLSEEPPAYHLLDF